MFLTFYYVLSGISLVMYANYFNYYIDYVLAQLCAFQFKIRMEKDHDAAWADYMKLCRLSASDFYPSMLKQVGLTVPFTDGCIQKIVDELDKKLS